jgi:hypothetical protein
MGWLARAGRSSHPTAEPLIGCKKMRPTDRTDKREPSCTSEPVFAARRQHAGSAVQHHTRQSNGSGTLTHRSD